MLETWGTMMSNDVWICHNVDARKDTLNSWCWCVFAQGAGGEGRVPGAEETQGSSTVLMSLKPEVAKGVVPMAVDGKGRFVKPERA